MSQQVNPFNDDLAVIQKLDDEPNDVDGLSAQQLKEKFDQAPLAIQKYINEVLVRAHNALDNGLDELARQLANHVDVDPNALTAANVSIAAALAEQYGLTSLVPNVHEALEKLGPIGKDATELAKLVGQADYLSTRDTFLRDETATLFGLDETAVPDLVFQQIPDAIGTIKTTVRADMPENWLLCNGASVRAEGYEELADVLADTWPEQTFDELFPDQGAVAYENGVWVKCGFDDARQIIVLYKSGLTEEWNRVETGITLSTARSISDNVYYSGGRWLLRINHSSGNAYIGGIDMCTAETLTGPWRYKPVYDYSSSSARIGNVIFADGYYAVVATTSHKDTPATCSLRLLYADDSGFDANSWTNITLRTQDLSRGAAGVAELFYSDGKWIVQSNMPTRDSSGNYTVPNRALQMAQSLSGNWSDIPSPGVMSGLEHINGRWEATLAADHSRACTDELTSGWTIKSEQWGLAKVQGYIVERGIEFSTSSVARAFNYRAFGQAFQTNNASASLVPSTNTAPFRPIACIDKEIFFSNNVVIGRLPPGFVLPAIATDGAYTYIKANEGADR